MEKKGTCFAVRSVPPTSAASAKAGGDHLTSAGVIGSSRVLGMAPRDPPELAEWLEGSFDDRRKMRQVWVLQKQLEVGEEVCCSLGQLEACDRLLDAG